MRDQGAASENVLDLDISHIDENTTLSPEDLDRMVTAIANLSTEVIEPTFATGQNTKILISLCQKMDSLAKGDYIDAMQDQLGAIKALTNINRVAEALNKTDERSKYDIEYGMVLQQIRDAEGARLRVTSKYGDATKEFEAAVRTMIKLGNGLLADQEEHGASIKTGKHSIKYAFTCKAIDGQWKALKGAFMDVKKSRKAVQNLEKLRRTEKVMFVDTGNDNKLVAGHSFAELSKAVAEIAEMEEK